MQQETNKALEQLKRKIATIINNYEEADYYRNLYSSRLTETKKKLEELNKKITEQEKKIEHYELKEAFASSGGDDKRARLRLNRLIKEIDKCINLLSE